jgi:hypothetical protein
MYYRMTCDALDELVIMSCLAISTFKTKHHDKTSIKFSI